MAHLLDSIQRQWMQLPEWARAATFVALPAVIYLTARLTYDYQGWLALGPGGLPHNARGYLTNVFLTLVYAETETKSLGVYDNPTKHAEDWKQASSEERTKAQESYLSSPLSRRRGEQSESLPYTAPQREQELDKHIDPDGKAAYIDPFGELAKKHNGSIEWQTSVLEKRGNAMFLRESYNVPTLIAKCKREIAHIHESDMSSHVLLSFADAKEVIAKGWGERHRLTGTSILPLGYTMLYRPKSVEEIEVFMMIFEAGIKYAESNGKVA